MCSAWSHRTTGCGCRWRSGAFARQIGAGLAHLDLPIQKGAILTGPTSTWNLKSLHRILFERAADRRAADQRPLGQVGKGRDEMGSGGKSSGTGAGLGARRGVLGRSAIAPMVWS